MGNTLVISKAEAGMVVSGRAARVPWGDACPHVVVVAEGEENGVQWVGLATRTGLTTVVERNLSGEPRVMCTFERTPLLAAARLPGAVDRLELEGALYRSVQMTGALERILAYTLQYANERVQFGRAIGRFQAIQHMLAIMAGHVAASSAVTDAAVESAAESPKAFAVAVAKSRVGEAASKSTEIAHQVHGAMGYTHEHNLHHSTRRLWAWREEFGNEAIWQTRLGNMVAAKGPDSLWVDLTTLQRAVES
jgi:acyl-CoA dehydrogenase